MARLSVNINKIATLRNSRGGNNPNVLEAALACERFGAQGITVHPRPDERHIRYQDVFDLQTAIHTELNIEGHSRAAQFVRLVLVAQDRMSVVSVTSVSVSLDLGGRRIYKQ